MAVGLQTVGCNMKTKLIAVGKVVGHTTTLTVTKDLEFQAILSLMAEGYSRIVIKSENNQVIVEGYRE